MDAARVSELLAAARIEAPIGSEIEISGRDPILASRFSAGEAAAVAIGLVAAGAERLYALRTGIPQVVGVDVQAAATSLISFLFQGRGGGASLARNAGRVTDLFEAGDGRFVHLHGGFPHLAVGTLALLGCADEKAAIARAVAKWSAFDLENALAERGMCGAAVRTPDEWADHPQGRALASLPAVEVEKIGESEPKPLADSPRPLGGARVLDLTRVLAGPACGRALAEHGASVLRVGAARLPSIEPFVIDTGRGKRNTYLDLDRRSDVATLRSLAAGADVFCQGYRPGGLARRGFGPRDLAEQRPGTIYVSIDCYGHVGPWAARPGWEQLAQSASGIAHTEGGEGPPRLLPAAATDYTTGALAAYGVMTALLRRSREGGSYHVRASLAQTAMWLLRIGADQDPERAAGLGDVGARTQDCDTHWGVLSQLRPVATLSVTPPRWELPPAPLGSHAASWV